MKHDGAGSRPGRGALLVEFLPDCRCTKYRTEDFPFLQGYLKSRGVSVSWVYLPRTEEYGCDLYTIDPPEAHTQALLREAERLGVSAILLNCSSSESFGEALKSGFSDGRVFFSAYAGSHDSSPVSGFLEALGFPPEKHAPDLLLDTEPDYTSHNLLGMKVELFPLQEIHSWDPPCRHQLPIAKNPFFSRLDMEGVRQDVGCSFCLGLERGTDRGELDRLTRAERLALTRRQLRRFNETAPPERQHATFGGFGALVFPDVLQEALDLPLQPSVFYFVNRADEIVRAEEPLRRIIPRLAERGHRVVFDCMGVENFSPEENQRFNKGLDAKVVERSFRLLHELESRWPQTLWFFRGYGPVSGTESEALGFMMIFFTPWTKIDDLVINLDTLERLGETIEPLRRVHHQLVSRLKLLPGAAITMLAERDGLVESEFPEPMRVADVHPGMGPATEVPWRFASRQVATVYRLAIRLIGDGSITKAAHLGGSDPLVEGELARIKSRARQEGSFLPMMRELVDAVRDLPEGASDLEISRRLKKRLGWPEESPTHAERVQDSEAAVLGVPSTRPGVTELPERIERLLTVTEEIELLDLWEEEGTGLLGVVIGANGLHADAALVAQTADSKKPSPCVFRTFWGALPHWSKTWLLPARLLALGLDPASWPDSELRREHLSSLRSPSSLQQRAELAVQNVNLSLQRRGGFLASWPVCQPNETVVVWLNDAGTWVELMLEELRPGQRAYLSTALTAVSHAASTPLDTDDKRDVVGRLVEELRKVEEA